MRRLLKSSGPEWYVQHLWPVSISCWPSRLFYHHQFYNGFTQRPSIVRILRRSFKASSHWKVCFTCVLFSFPLRNWQEQWFSHLKKLVLLTLISHKKWIPLFEMKACLPFCVLTIAIITWTLDLTSSLPRCGKVGKGRIELLASKLPKQCISKHIFSCIHVII